MRNGPDCRLEQNDGNADEESRLAATTDCLANSIADLSERFLRICLLAVEANFSQQRPDPIPTNLHTDAQHDECR
jgi:hypothetical protein